MIKDIIYFNDYSLYAKCEIEAQKSGLKINHFITGIIADIIEHKTGTKKHYKKATELWIDCEKVAKIDGVPIATFIETSCRKYFEEPEPQRKSILQKINELMTLPKG